MSQLRFHHVFYVLMALSGIVAFLIPGRFVERYQPRIEILFSPVARPAGVVGRMITRRTEGTVVPANDHRLDPEVRAENEALRGEVMRLNARVAELNRQQNELGKLTGALRELCKVTKVIGFDSGNRDSISISGTSFDGIKQDMYVVINGGLVGQVARVGSLGSQVKLVTDPAFGVRVKFLRFDKEFLMQLPIAAVVVQGIGAGRMSVTQLSLANIGLDANLKPLDAVAGPIVKEGDYVQIDDNECPAPLQGLKVGRVVKIGSRRGARLYADIQIEPITNLQRLPEVMVMTRER
ncbi:MAG TPA: rod shape-determining protein MreC [Tepidisphaeraceae bacterium]|jgi:cell shape-determining protein MreC